MTKNTAHNPNSFSLLPTREIIRLAQKRGVSFGKGQPENRIRYYTKVGLLPHTVRKESIRTRQARLALEKQTSKTLPPQTEGHYPGYVIDQLCDIQNQINAGLTITKIRGARVAALGQTDQTVSNGNSSELQNRLTEPVVAQLAAVIKPIQDSIKNLEAKVDGQAIAGSDQALSRSFGYQGQRDIGSVINKIDQNTTKAPQVLLARTPNLPISPAIESLGQDSDEDLVQASSRSLTPAILGSLTAIALIFTVGLFTLPKMAEQPLVKNTVGTVLSHIKPLLGGKTSPSDEPIQATIETKTIASTNLGKVLAARTPNLDLVTINADTDVIGNLTAPNIVYGIVAGQNVQITGDKQKPTISVSGVAEKDTLQTVSDRGASTTAKLILSGGVEATNLVLSDILNLGKLASDPTTATNGATYYNTANNRFRCYVNGAWKDCDTSNSSGMTNFTVSDGSSSFSVGDGNTLKVTAGTGMSISTDTSNRTLTLTSTVSGGGVTSVNSLTGALTIAGAGINSVSASGTTVTVTGTEADTLATVTGRGATTTTAVALNGGITSSSATPLTLSSTAPVIAIGDTGTLAFTDGSNTLCSIADAGTTGNLTCTGNITGSSSGTVGYWSRSSTTLSPATANDVVSIANTTTSGADFALTNTGVYTGTGLVAITANSATSGDILTLSGTALTSGSLVVLTGPSGGTAGVTDAALKITSDVGNIGTSNGLINATATIDSTAASANGINLYLSTTNSDGTNANTAYAVYNTLSDAIALGNTNYGSYTTVSNTGAINGAITKTIYGNYISASGTGATTNASIDTEVYGQYITTTATNATDNGTVNNYGLYIANGTSSTNGTSTKYGLYIAAQTGADTNYALYIAGGTAALADGALLDLSAINVSSTTEGLKLPQSTSCASGTAEGQICWDTDNDILYVGDGATSIAVGSTSLWTDGGTFTYLASTTDDLILGGSTVAASSFFMDVSAGALYLGTNESINGLLTFYSSGVGVTDATIGTNSSGDLALTSSTAVNITGGTGDITLQPGASNVVVNLDSTGDFLIKDAGTAFFTVNDTDTDRITYAYGGTTTNGFVYNADSLTQGQGLVLTTNALTTGKALSLTSTSNAYTTGNLLNAALTQSAATGTSVSGNIAALTFSPTYSTAITTPAISGNVLNLSRTTTTNSSFASTLTLSGEVFKVTDTITQTTGTITSTNDTASITRSCPSGVTCSGAILDLIASGAGTDTTGLKIQQSSSGTLTTAIDASDETITNAISVAANTILGTTGAIDYTNFDVATTGNITVATSVGLDTNATGALSIGDTTATTVNIGSTAATTLNLGNGGVLTRTINIGTGTGADTINIGTGGSTADALTFGNTSPATTFAFNTGVSSTTAMAVTANSVNSGTALSVSTTALSTGIGTSLTGGGATTLTTGSVLKVTGPTGAAAIDTNGVVNLTAAGAYTSTTNGGLLNLVANSTATGVVERIDANALTTGQTLSVQSTGTGLTSGSLLRVTSATTGAVATNGIVSLVASGNYTSSANVGLLSVQADATTAGTIQNISGNALTTGTGLYIGSTSNAYSTGKLLNLSLTQTAATGTSVSGNVAAIAFSPIYSTAVTTPTISGNLLNIARSATTNASFASTLTVSGDVAALSSNCTQTTGTCTDTGKILSLTQSYASATGAVLGITNSATAATSINIASNSNTTADVLNISATALTLGSALNITGPSSTGVGANFVKLTSDLAGAAMLLISADFSGSGASSYGINIQATDSTTNVNSDYGINNVLTLSGNAGKTAYGIWSQVISSSQTADTLSAGRFLTSVTGAISTGTRNQFTLYSTPTNTAANTGGTTNIYGLYSIPSYAAGGDSSGSTNNVYGLYTSTTGTLNTGGTVNQYGLYVANGTSSTTGTSTKYGLYIEALSGADTNVDLAFAGTAPKITIGDGGTLSFTDGTNTLCSIADAGTTGNLSCTGNITGSSSGTVGFWTRTSTTLSPATGGDNVDVGAAGNFLAGQTTGKIGLGGAVSGSDVLSLWTADSTQDWAKVISITQANNAAEDSTVLDITNTVSPGAGSRTIKNIGLSLTPTAATAGDNDVIFYGIYNALSLSNTSLGNGSSSNSIQAAGNRTEITANPTFNGTGASNNVSSYGSFLTVSGSPTLTSVAAGSAYTSYGLSTQSTVTSAGDANLGASSYGISSAATGNLTTTGTTNHYAGYFNTSGTADNNYGVYVNSVASGTNNYGLYINTVASAAGNWALYSNAAAQSYFAGNMGIGTDTTPTEGILTLVDTSNTVPTLYLDNSTATTLGAGVNTTGILDLQSTTLNTGNFMNIETNALTSGKAVNITSTSTTLTSGSLLALSSATTGAVATNGIVYLTATGNYTSSSNVGLLNLVANSTTAGTVQNLSATGLTTGVGLNLTGGTAMTTGNVLAIASSTFVHTVNSAESGSLASLTFTDASTDANAVTTTTNGLNIASTINTSGAGTKNINGINIAAPTATGCATGNCVWDGVKISTLTSGAASTITSNGIEIIPTAIASGTLNGIKIGALASAGAGSEYALSIGNGWDASIKIDSSQSNAFKIGDGTNTYVSIDTSTPLTTIGSGSGDISIVPSSSGNVIVNLGASSATGDLLIQNNGTTFAKFAQTGVTTFSYTNSTADSVDITPNSLTTGVALNVTSTGTGLTSGSLINVSSATTGAVATNGIVSLNATGAYTSTSNVGLLNLTANSTTTGTVMSINANGLTASPGVGLLVKSTGTGLTSGSLLQVSSATTGAVATNGIVSLVATGAYTSTLNVGLLTVNADSTTLGTVALITGNALTTGNGLRISSTGTGMTTGSLLYVTSATTGVVNTNGIVSINATGAYTSTSNNGLVNVLANTTTAGTVVNISATSSTSGVGLRVAGNTGIAIQVSGGDTVIGTAALATNATTGFLYIPTSAGNATGTPASHTGTVAMEYDTTNNKLLIYNGAWKGATAPGAWSDVAEWAPAAGASSGDIVSLTDQPNPVVGEDPSAPFMLGKSNTAYDGRLAGVISQYAEDSNQAMGYKHSTDYHALTLNGRVPTKVSTINGPIHKGDFITASTIAGVGMKATEAGMTVGQALEEYANSDTTVVGSIMVLVHVGYVDPTILAPAVASVDLNKIATSLSSVKLPTTPQAADQALANLAVTLTTQQTTNTPLQMVTTDQVVAGLEVLTGQLTANEVLTKTIAGIDNQPITVRLGLNGSWIIVNDQGDTAFSLDGHGNATFSGQLQAKSIKADHIEGLELLTNRISTLEAEASQSATQAASLAFDTNGKEATFSAGIAGVATDSATGSPVKPWSISAAGDVVVNSLKSLSTLIVHITQTDQLVVNDEATIHNGLKVLGGDVQLTKTSVGGTLTVGAVTIDDMLSSIDSLSGDLKLQYLAQGGINMINGKVVVDKHGNVTLASGDLKITQGVILGNNEIRGINEQIPSGNTVFTVQFPQTRNANGYAVTVTPSWLTNLAITNKTANGFTVSLSTPAPQGASVDWIVIE